MRAWATAAKPVSLITFRRSSAIGVSKPRALLGACQTRLFAVRATDLRFGQPVHAKRTSECINVADLVQVHESHPHLLKAGERTDHLLDLPRTLLTWIYRSHAWNNCPRVCGSPLAARFKTTKEWNRYSRCGGREVSVRCRFLRFPPRIEFLLSYGFGLPRMRKTCIRLSLSRFQ